MMKIIKFIVAFFSINLFLNNGKNLFAQEVTLGAISESLDQTPVVHHPELIAYIQFLNELKPHEIFSATEAAAYFKKHFTSEKNTSDSAFTIFYEYLYEYLNAQKQIYRNNPSQFLQTLPNKNSVFVDSAESSETTILTHHSFGFLCITSLGKEKFIISPQFLQENFRHALSSQGQSLLDRICIDLKRTIQTSKGSYYLAQEWVDRAIWYENYCKENKSHVLYPIANKEYIIAMEQLCFGSETLPIYGDPEKLIINNYYRSAMAYLMKTYDGSSLHLFLEKYYGLVAMNKNTESIQLFNNYVNQF